MEGEKLYIEKLNELGTCSWIMLKIIKIYPFLCHASWCFSKIHPGLLWKTNEPSGPRTFAPGHRGGEVGTVGEPFSLRNGTFHGEKYGKMRENCMNTDEHTAIFMRKRRKTALVFICLIFFWWTSEFILRVWRWTYCHSNIVFLFGWTLGDFRLKPATWEFCSKSWGLTV